MHRTLTWQFYGSIIVIFMFIILACGYFGHDSLILTQMQVPEVAGVLCLPTKLPNHTHPIPLFYLKSGDPPFWPTTVYTDTITSERIFEIIMTGVSSSTRTEEDYQSYDSYLNCEEDRFILSNGFRVCNTTGRMDNTKSEENALIKGPPFISSLSWLVHRDDTWTMYNFRSSLPLEETKNIAASMECLE